MMTDRARERAILADLAAKTAGGAHSLFAPSAAHRWLVCPGSLVPAARRALWAAELDEDADNGSIFAAEGTVAHEIAALILEGEEVRGRHGTLEAIRRAYLGVERKVGEHVIIPDEDMFGYVQQYVDWINDLGDGDARYVETRVDFSDLTPVPKQGGTVDHMHIAGNTLTITDLKYGKGIEVYAERNPQLSIYAYGALKVAEEHVIPEWDAAGEVPEEIEIVRLRICQPRREHFDVWETTADEIRDFARHVKERAEAAWRLNAPRSADAKACRFCPLAADPCPELERVAEEMVDASFDVVEPEEVTSRDLQGIDPVRIGRFLRWRPVFVSLFKQMALRAERMVSEGTEVPGWKLGEGRGSRRWTDEKLIADYMEIAFGLPPDECYTRSLRTPNEMADHLKARGVRGAARKISPFVSRVAGRQKLVEAESRRGGIEDDDMDDVFD